MLRNRAGTRNRNRKPETGTVFREDHSMDQYRSRLQLSENFEHHWSIQISGEIHMDQSLVHTFSWGNSYGPMVLKVFLKFPPTLVLVHGWLFPGFSRNRKRNRNCQPPELKNGKPFHPQTVTEPNRTRASLSLIFFSLLFGKKRGKPPQKQGFVSMLNPKIPGKKGKHVQKRKFHETKKQGNPKK